MRLLPLLLLAVACHMGESKVTTTCDDLPGGCDDLDRDGFVGEEDCDPSNGAINPAAADVLGDDVDQNCDGVDGLSGGVTDDDGDRDGYPDTEDCDPTHSSINPSATDIVGDSVDQNCDGIDGTDSDGDGEASLASGGGDCDDLSSSVNPGATDTTTDGVDQDCDGVDGPSSAATFSGDITLNSDADLVWFCADYDSVRGTLSLGSEITDLAGLACLREVSGSLLAEDLAATALKLPNLERVGEDLHLYAADATTFFMPRLAEVNGSFYLEGNGLETVSLPSLTSAGALSIGGALVQDISLGLLTAVDSDMSLTVVGRAAVDAPLLTTIGGTLSLYHGETRYPLTVDLSSLESVNYISVNGNLNVLDFPALTTATSGIFYADIAADGAILRFPVLTSTSYIVAYYATSVDAPSVQDLPQLYLYGNLVSMNFDALTTLGSMELDYTLLTNLSALSGLGQLNGTLYLSENSRLSDIRDLEDVTGCTYANVTYNSPITDSEATASLDRMGVTSYYVYGNAN
ncbi:MAG TPA: putative metal-binding motif-containing protein [Myxococcota bacterium]|nr:putative metal-binding motif-containing protein [Myxococcota bacterium]